MANNQNSRDLAQETAANLTRKEQREQALKAGLRQERAAQTAGHGRRRI